jgi:hypothetical protein
VSKIHDDEISALLQKGLREAEVPAPAADFDDRVRARLRRPEPFWQAILRMLQPLAAPAACSLAVSLALLIVMGTPTPGRSRDSGPKAAADIALDPSVRARSIDQELDRLDNDTPTLSGFRRTPRRQARDNERRDSPILHQGTSERQSAIGVRG